MVALRSSLGLLGLLGPLALAGCGSCEPAPVTPSQSAAPQNGGPRGVAALPVPPSYEVHEWGLVRGDLRDRVYLSGPHREPAPMPMAKPVLYFHRDGEGPLAIDVEVDLPLGRIVEHWPIAMLSPSGTTLAWRGVQLAEGTCPGARYPGADEAPCSALQLPSDCESLELRTVETTDADCVSYGGASWNHLFYRGEIDGAPPLPLELAPLGGDRYRLTHRGTQPIVGRLVRVRGSVASVLDAPLPGASVELELPAGVMSAGAEALGGALGDAGLTPAEVSAFRRAWDATLFPGTASAGGTSAGGEVVTATPMAGGLIMPQTSDALLYVLPVVDAERLSTLRFTPAPRAVRRAIAVWLDLPSARPAHESPY